MSLPILKLKSYYNENTIQHNQMWIESIRLSDGVTDRILSYFYYRGVQ